MIFSGAYQEEVQHPHNNFNHKTNSKRNLKTAMIYKATIFDFNGTLFCETF
jgi:hypothetical protein